MAATLTDTTNRELEPLARSPAAILVAGCAGREDGKYEFISQAPHMPDMPETSLAYRFHHDGSAPMGREIFVFGSNTGGIHGKDAALVAWRRFGAIIGVGAGRMGQAYALPTKHFLGPQRLFPLPIGEISQNVATFLSYARAHSAERFFVTRVGCGLAEYTDEEIAPLFVGAPINCSFAMEWRAVLIGEH